MGAQNLITQRDLAVIPQCVVEGRTVATYNTIPASPTFFQTLTDAILLEGSQPNTVDDRIAGDVDRQNRKLTRKGNEVMLKGRMQSHDENLLKWCMKKPDGTAGSPDESRAFVQAINNAAGDAIYQTYKGCKPKSATLALGADYTTLEITMSYRSKVESDTAVATLDASTTNDPLYHTDIPTDPFEYNSTDYEMRAFSTTVAFDEAMQDSLGTPNILFRKPSMRRISGSFDVFKIDEDMQGDAALQTARDLIVKVRSGIVLTFAGLKIDPSGEDIRGDTSDATIESHSFTADTLAIA